MKKRLASVLILLVLLIVTLRVNAEEIFSEPTKIRCTVYCDSGVTKSGAYTREGIAAMNNKMLGKTAILYDMDMNLIGIFEVLDTGGNKHLKAGKRIDIYRESKDACDEWIKTYGDYVYIQLIDAEG